MSQAADILSRLEQFGIRLGLDTTENILAELGDPQRRLRIALVAGTNGKGSTAAFLQSFARAAGYRTGFYTSPHLETPHERIRVDGRAIGERELAETLERVVAVGERRNRAAPTYFEALTAAAYAYFAAQEVELAIVEVGLGGRLDATNAAEPILSAITPIALDHREYLGDTLGAIAGEKAGIFRPGVPAWIAEQESAAAEALRAAADRLGTPLRVATESVRMRAIELRGWEGQEVRLDVDGAVRRVSTSLAGEHQAGNLALAVAAALELGRGGFPRLDLDAIERGAASCRWPGRLELVSLPSGRRVVLDGAHNPAGIEALVRFLRRLGEPVDLLFGALADKDASGMLPPLAALAETITLTAPPTSRALDPRDLALLAPGRPAHVEADPATALDRALDHGDPARALLVCGSLYLIGDIRAELRRRFGVPAGLELI